MTEYLPTNSPRNFCRCFGGWFGKQVSITALLIGMVLGVATGNLLAMPQEMGAQDLFDAAQTGDLEKIKTAIEAGVDVNSKTRYSATALSFAAEKGHLEIVKLLLENGADVAVKDTFYNATPLQWAMMKRHKEIIKLLKENGAEMPTLKADPERARKKEKSGAKDKGQKNDDQPEEEEETFGPSSAAAKLADREVSSANWAQFRGNGARGVADGQNPPINWSTKTGQNMLWKTAIPGLGHSCPVVFGDFVYLTTAISSAGDTSIKPGQYGGVDSVEDDSEHSFVLLCLNKDDGSVVWQKEATKAVPKVKRHLKSTHANCTVATDGTHVVAFFAGEGLFVYTTDGELVWKKDLGMLDSGWFYDKSYQWGFAASPIIFEGNVIVQCDVQETSFIAAYSLSDGSESWRTDRDEIPGWSTPTVVDSPRGPMLLTCGTGFARGYNARNGEEWWRFGKHSEIVVPTPFVAHDLIYITSGYTPIQPIVAISLDAEGDITLEEGKNEGEHIAWYKARGGTYMPSPIVYGDFLYLCANSGIITCIQATTGKQVYRTRLTKGLDDLAENPGVGGSTSMVGSPIAADGHIYFPCEEGFVFVVKAGPDFEMVAANPIGENLLTTPAISEGVFFVRGQNHLLAMKAGAQMEVPVEESEEVKDNEEEKDATEGEGGKDDKNDGQKEN